MKIFKNKASLILIFSGIFIFLYIFYTQVHPIIIKVGDDWTYISASRKTALPSLKEYNPAKIFPETILPQLANIAVYIVYPITKDYIKSFTIVFALAVASIITIYVYSFYRWSVEKFSVSELQGGLLSVLFFLFHYLIFIEDNVDNLYLFKMYDINNYFNYTIPALLNLILIFCIESNAKMKTYQYYKENPFGGGIIVLLLYIAIFSNLFCSYLLAIYAGISLLYDMIFSRWNKKGKFSVWVGKHITYFFILGLWLAEAYFESQGTRAARALGDRELSYIDSVKDTLLHLKEQLLSCNTAFLIIMTVSVFLFIIILLKERKLENSLNEVVLKFSFSILLAMTYIVLLSSMIYPTYSSRMDVLIGPASFLFMCILSVLAYILKNYAKTMVVIPFVCYVLFYFVLGSVNGRVLEDLKNPQAYANLGNYYIEQFKEADRNGCIEFILDASSDAPYYLGDRIAMTLYKHGIVSRLMSVKTRKNPAVNAMFDLR